MNLQELINAGQFEEAIEQCKQLIAEGEKLDEEATSLTGYVYLGIIYTRQKKFTESKKIFDDNYLAILDECTEYWVGTELINTYLTFGETTGAINYINEYLSKHPNDFKALYLKGHIQYVKKSYKKALKNLLAAHKINQSNKGLLYNIGLVYKVLSEKEQAFYYFELAYNAGNNAAIEEILKLLFERTGECDFINCENPCCEGVQIKGLNGLPISTIESFNGLVLSDSRNACWVKKSEGKQGNWVFGCSNFGHNNFCNDYQNRPAACRSYPSSITSMRSCCSYRFKLTKNPLQFSSKSVLLVVVEILESYKYPQASKKLLDLNGELID